MEQSDLIFGRNTVKEAIKSGRSIDKIFVAAGNTDGSIRELVAMARERKLVVITKDKKYLDELCAPYGYKDRGANHQGVAAFVSSAQYCEMEDILAEAEKKGEPPFIIVLDGITDVHNLGAILRSAECFGAHGVVLSKRGSAPVNNAVYKAACGATEYVKIARVPNISAALEKLKEKNIWVAAADMEGQSTSKVDLSGALALVVGDEGEGVSRLVLQNCDFRVKIDIQGKIESLNASVAAGVLMYEKRRQDAAKH